MTAVYSINPSISCIQHSTDSVKEYRLKKGMSINYYVKSQHS